MNENTCSLVIFYSMSMTSEFVWKLRVDMFDAKNVKQGLIRSDHVHEDRITTSF